MRDLEDKLRELLDQKAEDAISRSAAGMPDEVRARMRRRQALTTTLGGLTLAAIVSLSVLGTRAVLKPETTGQPLGPTIGTEPVPEVVEISPEVSFSPPRGVRGAELRVTVEGLHDYPGAQVELGLATKEGTEGQGVGSGEDRVDENGRLETTITVPGVLGHEYQVVPGDYRMVFGVKPLSPEPLRFEETLQVIAAAVGEKYPYTPSHECLEYVGFDGRLWERESGDLTTPVPGSTIELTASDRAVYMTPEGKTVVFRPSNAVVFDPPYRCPPR